MWLNSRTIPNYWMKNVKTPQQASDSDAYCTLASLLCSCTRATFKIAHTKNAEKLYHCRMLKRSREPLNEFSVSKRELNFIQRCWHSMVRLWILWMRVSLICNVIALHAVHTKSIFLSFSNWIESEHYIVGDFNVKCLQTLEAGCMSFFYYRAPKISSFV